MKAAEKRYKNNFGKTMTIFLFLQKKLGGASFKKSFANFEQLMLLHVQYPEEVLVAVLAL